SRPDRSAVIATASVPSVGGRDPSSGRWTVARHTGTRSDQIEIVVLDVPVAGDDAEVGRGLQVAAVHQPNCGIAAVVAPQDVAGAVGVEVAAAERVPVVGDDAEVDGSRQVSAVDLPDQGVAI